MGSMGIAKRRENGASRQQKHGYQQGFSHPCRMTIDGIVDHDTSGREIHRVDRGQIEFLPLRMTKTAKLTRYAHPRKR